MTNKKLHTIELFAGCGGLLEGFLQQGKFDTLACVEWEKYPCETLKKRLATKWKHSNVNNEVIRFDIQRTEELINGFSDEEYGENVGLDKLVKGQEVDLIVGGPPCQAYSLAGRIRDANGMRNDYRNYLFESYIKIVKHFKPKFFVFENVIGLLSAAPDGYPIINRIRESFLEAGYNVALDFKKALFEVADFGIPQHRKRVIIIGIRMDHYDNNEILKRTDMMISDFYDVIMPSLKRRKRTVSDAIDDLPKIYPLAEPIKRNGKKFSHSPIYSDEYMNHVPRFHSQRDIEVFRLLADDIKSGRCEYVKIEALKELYTKVTGKKSNIHKYYVLRENEQSNTIPAHLYKDGMRHIHPDPEQARSITVREAARLQTFPDDFEFLGPSMAQYKMIGNAVPVQFAEIVAEALYRLIKKYNCK